jgi:hypothetical protein
MAAVDPVDRLVIEALAHLNALPQRLERAIKRCRRWWRQ